MKPTTAQDYRDRVLRVITYIGDHLNEPLSLETLAEVAHFSPYHFHRIFRGLVGETLGDHIRRRRLEAAGVALRRGETVLSVTLDAGYESPEAFGRAFKALYGMAPSRFATAQPPPRPRTEGHNVVRGADGLLLTPPFKSRRTDMNIDIVTLNDIPVAYIRHTGPYESAAHAFERIIGWAIVNGHMHTDTLTLGRYYDDPQSVPPDRLRADACVSVPAGTPSSGDIECGTVPGGTYAKAVFTGPPTNAIRAYEFIFGEWLPGSGREAADAPCMEVYTSDPADTPPERQVTEIYVPLQA